MNLAISIVTVFASVRMCVGVLRVIHVVVFICMVVFCCVGVCPLGRLRVCEFVFFVCVRVSVLVELIGILLVRLFARRCVCLRTVLLVCSFVLVLACVRVCTVACFACFVCCCYWLGCVCASSLFLRRCVFVGLLDWSFIGLLASPLIVVSMGCVCHGVFAVSIAWLFACAFVRFFGYARVCLLLLVRVVRICAHLCVCIYMCARACVRMCVCM